MNQQPNTVKRSLWQRPPKDETNRTSEYTNQTGLKKGSVDVPFLLITAALVLFGCVMIYSASFVFAQKHHNTSTYFIIRHVIFLMMAVLFTFVVVKYCTPRFWYDFSYIFYGISIVLLLLVLTPLGTDLNSGARRWIDLKVITLQPSELAKLALVLTLARFMTTHEKEVLSPHKFGGDFKYGVLFPGLMIAGVGGLVALEKHISALAIIGMLGISLMFLGGTRIKWIASLAGIIAVAACMLIIFFPYAFARVDTWLNIEEADPLGSAWQTLQGLMAIGSGGLFGKGLGNSQQKYGFVSQPQNDFIFTIICEEFGFIGAILVIGLFIAFVWRGFHIARHAPDKCSSLIVYGLTFKVALQVILNIAVVTNSMPNTGISLPFFSYGGTSLMLQILEVGIILSISRYASHKKI
ncbi:MAG: cell division protein FtsW [Ruminococcaceae bacterium]|nr:cell division protein FtsW [Oscillospiraceae bacterium]